CRALLRSQRQCVMEELLHLLQARPRHDGSINKGRPAGKRLSFPNSVWEPLHETLFREQSSPRRETKFRGDASPNRVWERVWASMMSALNQERPAAPRLWFPNSVWEPLHETLLREPSSRRRETKFRGDAFPNRVWERVRASMMSALNQER